MTKKNNNNLLSNDSIIVEIKNPFNQNDVYVHELRQPSQIEFVEYEKKRNKPVSIDMKGELKKTDDDDVEIDALMFLYDKVRVSTMLNGKEFKNEVPAIQKLAAVKVLFHTFTITQDRVVDDYGQNFIVNTSKGNVIYHETLHENRLHLTAHVLKEPDLDLIKRYKRINTSSKIKFRGAKMSIIPHLNTDRYSDLYNDLFVEAHYYKENEKEKIPVIHKIDVVNAYFKLVNVGIDDLLGN